MNMKRPLAFLLAAGMTLGLAACGGNGGTSGSGSSGSSGSAGGSAVTLDLWAFNIGGFTEASNWDTILAAFNEQHPDITVNVTPINYQDGDQKLTSAITSNSGPDIIFEGPERIVGNYAREGLMVDLSDLWTESGSDIAEGISSVSQLDGTYYMYPLSVAAHCMAINYEVFEAAGALQYIDEETRTWSTDDFVAAMEAIKTAIDNGTVSLATPGIVYCGAQGGEYSDYYVNDDGTSYNANSANNVKALTLLQEMVNEGSLSANASYAAADELQAFANQTCAVTFCWNYSNYTQYAEQTQFTPFAMAFPSDDSQPELEMAGPYGFGVFDLRLRRVRQGRRGEDRGRQDLHRLRVQRPDRGHRGRQDHRLLPRPRRLGRCVRGRRRRRPARSLRSDERLPGPLLQPDRRLDRAARPVVAHAG